MPTIVASALCCPADSKCMPLHSLPNIRYNSPSFLIGPIMNSIETAQHSSGSTFFRGPFAKPRFLFAAAALLLLMMLGGRELWTQEHRWADIVSGMFFRHDFF